MAKRYVPDGACLVCNKGLGFGKLKVTNHKNVSIYGEKSATEGDKVTGLNIPSLGICSVTRSACQPVPTKWSGVQERITIGPYRKLLEDSKLGCGIGGQISIHFSIPAAMLAVRNNMKESAEMQAKKLGAKVDDWFKKQFDDAEKRNNLMPDGKARNFGLGVVEGIYGGVKGIGEGLLFLKKMQDKAMDASLHAITHPVETAGQIKDAAVATKDATVKAAEWVSNTDNLKNTAAAVGEAHAKAYNWVTTPGNVQKAATSAYNGSVEKLQEAKEWAGKQSPRDWGNYTGRGAFEVGLMATGAGEAKAVVEGANVASKVGEGANVAGKLGEGANVVSKTANVGEKAAEGANLADKAVEGKRLGEVVSDKALVKQGEKKLLEGEGESGTYGELIDQGKVGDNITPHHMPSNKFMKNKLGDKYATEDGVAMNMEQPHPGKGGRHRSTSTYNNNMTKAEKDKYFDLTPRDALSKDIMDARKIYKDEGLYNDKIREGLQKVIKDNKLKYPDLYKK